MPARPNVLFVIIDQLRADCVTGALAGYLDLPNIRGLAAESIDFRNHFSVTAPCGPSRVSLLTGQYTMNHRAVRNGTPLRHDTPTLGTELRRAGYEPLLFGYTDTAQDPRVIPAHDPRLFTYEEVAAGFTEVLRLRLETDSTAWQQALAAKGYDLPGYPDIYRPAGDTLAAPAAFAAEDSETAFLTDRVLADLSTRAPGWCALVTYIRPHPPLVCPAPYNTAYDPAAMPPAQADANPGWHPYLDAARANAPIASTVEGFPDLTPTPETIAQLRALYFGLATEVDHHVGRLLRWLKDSGQDTDTVVILTSDHGEMLGDYGLWGKKSFHDACYHVPLMLRVPGHGPRVIDAPTESIDVMPTVLDLAGLRPPDCVDGRSLTPWLSGTPDGWRDATVSELDFGDPITPTVCQTVLGLGADEANLAVLRYGATRLVQFAADLPPVLFDANSDGSMTIRTGDPGSATEILALSQKMLRHRMVHAEGTFARTMITSSGVRVGAA